MAQFNCILCDRTATTEVSGYPSCDEDAAVIRRTTEPPPAPGPRSLWFFCREPECRTPERLNDYSGPWPLPTRCPDCAARIEAADARLLADERQQLDMERALMEARAEHEAGCGACQSTVGEPFYLRRLACKEAF